ncbi:hypothetical protein COCMIDRAFT_107467 [Bipolaris oryzae ATCC 44560]|uniref:Plastocyanin-like domain-containing protein n=1 Tax=Bipolaris oryzae ATCC 44560 TaxID=930090 RepID=W6YTM3_COCMI|nr:uncharacterized protein COCMIDRAFT_107467 [Bipolaris oryzae ATCC 44560]EUC40940.1 hypothetical protein COCMIDRAFT_107467 [Bipolaris oryzae ATCC 44560]
MRWSTSTTVDSYVAQTTSIIVVRDGGKLVFSPSSLNASISTIVVFNFLALKYTLTQS